MHGHLNVKWFIPYTFFFCSDQMFVYISYLNGTQSTCLTDTLSILTTKVTNLAISLLRILFALMISTFDKGYKSRKFRFMEFSSLFISCFYP